jgi:diguanylate cyclase (GGDEF)-like protein
LRSLAVTIAPNPAAEAGPDLAVGTRLQRLCDLLGVAGARLSNVVGATTAVVATAGNQTPVAGLETRAIAGTQPLVIADTTEAPVRFYAGMILPGEADHPSQLLSLFDPRPRSTMMATTIAAVAGEALATATIARQRRHIEAQGKTIADFTALEEQRRTLFDRASATARIGIWQCNLSDNSLLWTNGVYDLFEIPRNTPVTRELALAFYTDASRERMDAARSQAIANCSDFALDLEIVTAKGQRRWMRLTGAVESRDGVAHRIFGMKQDITEEKLLADRTRYLAEFDVMTGLANRSQFQARLAELEGGHAGLGALLLVDLDGFKQINDTHGHAIGDDCLRETARRLVDCCGGAELVARIGGDEFAVLLKAGIAPTGALALAQRIVETMRRPAVAHGRTLRLSASVGVANYVGGPADELFHQADIALYAAKAAGRDTSRGFEG